MQGVVQKIYADKKNSKKSGKPFTVYTLLIDGERYQCGYDKPNCNEGDMIEFTAGENTYGLTVEADTIEVLEKAQPKAPRSVGGGTAGKTSKDDYWTRKEQRDIEAQPRIERQSARRDAIDLVKLGVEAGLLQPKDYKDLQKFVQKQAEQFYDGLMSADTTPQPAPAPTPVEAPAVSQSKPRGRPSTKANPTEDSGDGDNDDPW